MTDFHPFLIFCSLLVIELTCTDGNKPMGRKRNQGKARRAAKAKAAEKSHEGEESGNNQAMTDGTMRQLLLSAQLRQLQSGGQKCKHGRNPSISTDITQFVGAFHASIMTGNPRTPLSHRLNDACSATWDEFAVVWNDSAKMEMAISACLSVGTQHCLEGDYLNARNWATFARYFEQDIAIHLKQTQALYNWPKIEDTYFGNDEHTLVKFFRHRIPCSCLDDKYEEVKHITKVGFCYSRQCSIPGGKLERSKTKYCSRCRKITYCSRKCQEADWSEHKPNCDKYAAMIAEFHAKQQNMQELHRG